MFKPRSDEITECVFVYHAESSCYFVSSDEFAQPYANYHCEERGGRLVSIHDDYEQAFVHGLVSV